MPQTPVQMGVAAIGATVAALLILRKLFKKRKNLKGQIVVITGASSGIGEGIIIAHFLPFGIK